MILNLLHRPQANDMKMFTLQQDMAHELGLKVTLLVTINFMQDKETVDLVKNYKKKYGDELGIWFSSFESPEISKEVGSPTQLWLNSQEDKKKIIQIVVDKFRQAFNEEPVCVGAYHMDAVSMKVLKEVCPSSKIAIAGCFEEGVKVYHGCNNSWYLFNEGMPWSPWYPSLDNTLRPAATAEEAFDIVAVPHLSRDLALSYEGRNDFFASHPANVQRGMGNDGYVCPYSLNLVDQYRMQEEYNDELSYYHVFVGPNWLSGSANIQDSDEITQGLYRELLEYFAELKSKCQLIDMYMGEFASWFRENVPIGKPQVYLAKEMLYGSGKHYFWYLDPSMRVLIDTNQGGSIGDLRPYAAKFPTFTGPDSPQLAIGTYPYIIQSQYRSGVSHHSSDGARTTLIVKYKDETIDLCFCRTKVADISRSQDGTRVKLTPASINFQSGLSVTIETTYHFTGDGKIIIERVLASSSDPHAELEATEYFKGCYGVTEYPQDMHGITLSVQGDKTDTMNYTYSDKKIQSTGAKTVSAIIPQINTQVGLEALSNPALLGQAKEGNLFNPYFTLALKFTLKAGKEQKVCLWIRKDQ